MNIFFEHAAGLALFSVKEFEEIGMNISQVEASVTELKKFNQVVKLVAFSPFKERKTALETINSISEGILSSSVQTFLEQNHTSGNTLGVRESKLASAITDALGFKCLCTGVVPEISRGINLHFTKLVKGFNEKLSAGAQLGLAHGYSKAKVKFNVNRVDNMIIQSIALLDILDKDINTFSMRIREWYSYHFPELYKLVPENYTYSKVANFIGNRKELSEEKLDALEEIVQDRAKAEAILEVSRSSMGMDISPIDLMNIETFAKRVVSLSEFRQSVSTYLSSKMSDIAPNISALIGDLVGARLISQAGSLTNLAKLPASTVQILGAEKALFRALKAKSNLTPKYGLLYHSTFIGRAEAKNKGRISRFLANKCSIASRMDCFTENPNNIFGEKLKSQVEERLNFYLTGVKPTKNIDAMKEAAEEFKVHEAKMLKKKKKKEKKKKSQGIGELDDTVNGLDISEVGDEPNLSKNELNSSKKKKRKSKIKDEVAEEVVEPVAANGMDEDVQPPKKKKKKSKSNIDE